MAKQKSKDKITLYLNPAFKKLIYEDLSDAYPQINSDSARIAQVLAEWKAERTTKKKDTRTAHELLWYLAHPYTKPDPESNVQKCIAIANHLIDGGFKVYAPIVMTHWMDKAQIRPADFWYGFDEAMMQVCDGIILPKGYELSFGCLKEYKWFVDHDKIVWMLV